MFIYILSIHTSLLTHYVQSKPDQHNAEAIKMTNAYFKVFINYIFTLIL